jgi:hypothetical protein
MTPAEKAKELIDKFSDHSDWDHHDEKGERIRHEKLCAIICVEQIIEAFPTRPDGLSEHNAWYYWQDVLDHLKKS